MLRAARMSVPAGLAVGALCAAGAIVVVVRYDEGWFDALIAATAVTFLPTALVGAAILRANHRNRAGWVLLIAGVALPLAAFCQSLADARFVDGHSGVPAPTAFAFASGIAAVLGVPLVGTFGVLLFPDGRLSGSRRARWLAWACAADLAALWVWAVFSPTLLGTSNPNVDSPLGVGAAGALVLAILAMAPLTALASRDLRLRARRTEPGDLRRGLSLAANASIAIPAAYALCIVVGFSGGDTTTVGAVENVAALAIAATAWVGIVKYGLFDLRTVAGRGLVYAALTAVVVAVYSVVSALLGQVVAGTLPAIVAAAVGAMAVLPLRDRLQRRVNRFVFGLRDDPAAAFGLLGMRLDAAAAPDDVLPAAARTVAEALRLRYVGIEVGGEHLGRWGEPVAGPLHHVDLPFGGESIGRLVLQRREPREPFSRADLALVDSLASHLGLAARAVALTHVERASHARMIAVREEERIRLRRKLHDELGPTLAGIALGIDTARRSLGHGTAASTDELLAPLRAEAERAVADIRRIAYNLRPPVLDQLGLGPALSEEALRMGRANVSIPAQLPPLPALVEVAAYRIATEAMINAARHAPGASVEVRVSVTGSDLELEVSDTGAGLPEGFRAGVGITSMRERAAELGGRLILTTLEPHGTRVLAHLPIGSPAL